MIFRKFFARSGATGMIERTIPFSGAGMSVTHNASPKLPRIRRGAPRTITQARFANASERVFAQLLDFYRVRWLYEPRAFPLVWDGVQVKEMLTPDFYLPDQDLYIELTTLKQSLVTEKNRKVRHLRALHPSLNIKLLYKRDIEHLLARYNDGPQTDSATQRIDRLLFSEAQIERRVTQLAEAVSTEYRGRSLIMVGVGEGASRFLADLARQVSLPVSTDAIAVSRFSLAGAARTIEVTRDVTQAIAGRDVLLVEDIVDTGLTLRFILQHLKAKGPRSLEVCALLDKPARRLINVPLRHVGFQSPPH